MGRAENAPAQSGEAATNWIVRELPKPDADGWIHFFDGKQLYGFIPKSSDSPSGTVRLENGLLRIDSATVQLDLDCNDLEFRARLKKVSGDDVKITVRNSTWPRWQGCATFFEGGGKFVTGKNDGNRFRNLIETNASDPYDDFFDLDITAIGDNLTLKANGNVIYSIAGSSVDYGGIRIHTDGGATFFKSVQVKILDKGPIPRDRFVQAVETNFTRWDKNQDGHLDQAEVTAAVQDPGLKGDAAAAAATLKSFLAASQDEDLPALTVSFFQSNNPLLETLTSEFQRCLKHLQSASGLPVFSQNSPTFAECRQVGFGDCYLVSVLGASLVRNPADIRQMITPDDQSGGYHVCFPDGTRVDTPPLTEGELAWIGPGPTDCLWQRTLEKAWGLRKICRRHGAPDPSTDPFDVVSGGSGENMLLSITGHRTVDYYLGKHGRSMTPIPKLRSALQNALQADRLVEAFTWDISNRHFVPDHAYAVLGYDSTNDVIKLWNPLRPNFDPTGPAGPENGYPMESGRFKMPLTEFVKIFAQVRAETDQPAIVEGRKVFP